MFSLSVELSAVLVLGVGAIFWLAGLSFGLKRQEKDIGKIEENLKLFAHCDDFKTLKERVEKDVDNLHSKFNELAMEIRKDMSDVKTTLARIEERMFRVKE